MFGLGKPKTQEVAIKEDYLMAAERRVITALTYAQERRQSLEVHIARLQADLADTIVVINAMEAANGVLCEATVDKSVDQILGQLSPYVHNIEHTQEVKEQNDA